VNTFLDEASVYVKAGDGGAGSMHFHREKYVPLGGPDGGDGGRGGSVMLRAERGVNTLFQFKRQRRFAAENGQAGGASRMKGRTGKDLEIKVPVGTIVRDQETGEVLGDLTRHGQVLEVVRGGHGGQGNVHFKTSTNQAPHFAEKGEPGTERWLDLELKLIADVGIIGLPNAGKSTLLSVISAARPKIADYPFTTLTPNLGVVDTGDSTFVAADIPGLIEGAHEGVGLGHEFLRHIERTLVLIHVVDGSSDDPMADFLQVNEELGAYEAGLMEKTQLVAVNKMDQPEARDRWSELDSSLKTLGYHAMAISAVTRDGIDALVYRVAEILAEQHRRIDAEHRESDEVEVITIKPPPDHFEVERRRKTFYVFGEAVERLAVMTDLESEEALYRLQRRLKRMGVLSALEKIGVHEGSKVRIGSIELTWDSSYEPESRTPRSRLPQSSDPTGR
jgi:GTP-binding protein